MENLHLGLDRIGMLNKQCMKKGKKLWYHSDTILLNLFWGLAWAFHMPQADGDYKWRGIC